MQKAPPLDMLVTWQLVALTERREMEGCTGSDVVSGGIYPRYSTDKSSPPFLRVAWTAPPRLEAVQEEKETFSMEIMP